MTRKPKWCIHCEHFIVKVPHGQNECSLGWKYGSESCPHFKPKTKPQ